MSLNDAPHIEAYGMLAQLPASVCAVIDALEKRGFEAWVVGGFDQERTDTLAEQVKILEEYLPKQVSGEELSALIGEVLAETGATTKKEMGRVMGALTQKTGGNFDKAAAAKELQSRLA